jgi:hypothetical protein
VRDASSDATLIERWWTRLPNAGVAIACGACSGGLVVLDVDPRNDGDATLRALERVHGPLPHTARVVTGGGGEHYYFRAQVGCRGVAVPSTLGPGVDVKTDGGYVVAPPSLHPIGARYRWDVGALLSETPLAPLPTWIASLASKPVPVRAAAPGPTGTAEESFLGVAFVAAGWAGSDLPDGKLAVRCPWFLEHSLEGDGERRGDGTDSSTAVLPPTTATALGAFRCLHAHCASRSTLDVIRALPVHAIEAAVRSHPRAYGALVRRLTRRWRSR